MFLAKETIDGTPYCIKLPIKFYYDNKSTINISLNPVQQGKTKHTEVNRNFTKKK